MKIRLNEGVKWVDRNNVVPANIAKANGFKPEYQGFEGGLEIWEKHVDFNPLRDTEQASQLLEKLRIRRFTGETFNGRVRITVDPNGSGSPKKPERKFARPEDIIPKYVQYLKNNNPAKLRQILTKYPELREALQLKRRGYLNNWWRSQDAMKIMTDTIFEPVTVSESKLKNIVAESVKKVLKEGTEYEAKYAECYKYLMAASKALDDVDYDGYDKNSPYTKQSLSDLDKLNHLIMDALFLVKDLGTNGREGEFDDSGYHSTGF